MKDLGIEPTEDTGGAIRAYLLLVAIPLIALVVGLIIVLT